MSRLITPPALPPPPEGIELSPVPNKSVAQAVQWYRETLDVEVTPRYVRASTESGELQSRIVAGRRHYATQELYRFIVTRPTHTAARRLAGDNQ